MLEICLKLWHKHIQNIWELQSLKTDGALLLYMKTVKKSFLNPLTSTLETCRRFLFPNWSHVCSGFQFSEGTGRIIGKKDWRVIRHQWAGPQKGRRAPKIPQQEVKVIDDLHVTTGSWTLSSFTSLHLKVKKPIRRKWCSGLGRGTAPSASTEGQRTLHRSKIRGNNHQLSVQTGQVC